MSKNHENRTVQYILMALNLVSIRYIGIVDSILNRVKDTFKEKKRKKTKCFIPATV